MGENASSGLWTQYSLWRADIDMWDIDADCIMIPCKKHVLTIMALWGSGVVSGMALLLVLRRWAVGFDYF